MESPSTLSTPTGAPSLSQALRAATHPVHQRLERRLGLATSPWSHARYASFLRATLAVVDAVEDPVAERLAPVFPRWDAERSQRLRDDLVRLRAAAGAPLPDAPAIDTTADAFGAAYVLQGSELGARFIAQELARRPGLRDEEMSYLRPRPSRGPGWPEFTAALDAHGREARDHERVIRAALGTFAAFERAFAREGFA